MNQNMEYVVLIGISQVSFIALLGLLISSLLVHINGSIAASVGGATLVVVAVLTFSIPVPIPDVVSHFPSSAKTPSDPFAQSVIGGSRPLDSVHDTHAIAAPWLNLSDMIRKTASIDSFRHPSPSGLLIKHTTFAAMIAIVFFGCVKLTFGLIAARRLLHSTRPITDDRLDRIASVIYESIELRRGVRFVECDQITCAAVSGCLRPTVLLPDHWRTWTDDELHCVLAHELAHVVRGDYAWRLASCVVTSLHYYNPLVHLFVRKLMFAQELSADAVAAATMEQENYLRALTSLALQRDDRDWCFSQTGVHPVFSGYLIRRIKMLKSKRNRTDVRNATAMKWAGIIAIMIVGGFSLATRGVAQPPTATQAESGPIEHVARLDAPKPTQQMDPTNGMFIRPRVDLSSYAENETGFIKVSLAEILQATDLKNAVPLVNQIMSHELQEWFSSDEKPAIDLNVVDQICGSIVLSTGHPQKLDTPRTVGGEGMLAGAVSEATNDQNFTSFVSFGMTGAYVKLKQPVDVGSWVAKFAPTSEAVTVEAANYYALPLLPSLGPMNILTANIDRQTIGFGYQLPVADSVNPVVDMLHHRSSPNQSAWADAFTRIDGGLISIVVTNKKIRTSDSFDVEDMASQNADETEIAMAKAVHRIEHTFETLCIGLDLDNQTQTLGIRVRFGCKNREDTEKIKEDVQLFFDLHRRELPDLHITSEDSDAAMLETLHQFVGRAVFDLVDHSDGTSDVYIHTSIDLPESLGTLASQMIADEFKPLND